MPAPGDVVADQLDPARLEGLFRIGVDEVSWRKVHRYLTVVADHDRDGAVGVGQGRPRRSHAGSVLRRTRRPALRAARGGVVGHGRRLQESHRRQASSGPATGNSKKEFATCTASPTPPTPPATWTGGWPGPAAAASPPSSPSPAPSATTATASSPPPNSDCRTPNWRASTARSASSTIAATGTTPPPPFIAMIYLCCGGVTVELPFN